MGENKKHKYQHKVLIVLVCLVVMVESRHSEVVEEVLGYDTG